MDTLLKEFERIGLKIRIGGKRVETELILTDPTSRMGRPGDDMGGKRRITAACGELERDDARTGPGC